MSDDDIVLRLNPRETQAVFRSLIDYRRVLQVSALRDSSIVGDEIHAVDAVSEKISLQFHYPAGGRNVVES